MDFDFSRHSKFHPWGLLSIEFALKKNVQVTTDKKREASDKIQQITTSEAHLKHQLNIHDGYFLRK